MSDQTAKTDLLSAFPKNDFTISRHLLNGVKRSFGRLTAIHQCHALYSKIGAAATPREFMEGVLKAMDIQPIVDEKEKHAIPEKGPLVVVANHPFGMIEGVILSAMLLSVRPDIKVMANSILDQIPQMRELLISVDPYPSGGAARANIGPMRKAIEWVGRGGALLVFPSGTVSHIHLSRREISDPAWNKGISRIIHKTQASVLPVFIDGVNSRLFQVLGLFHPAIRTAMLPRELMNKRQKKINLRIGKVLAYPQLRRMDSDERLTRYLRWRTYLLGHAERCRPGIPTDHPVKTNPSPISAPLDPEVCRQEVEALPVCQRLFVSGPYSVWQAASDQIPRLMLEIGRLRELSFRLAGEGTGRAVDLDEFDAHYRHLFIWNGDANEIVGAYRIGCTDDILDRYGRSGLYTSTLFDSHSDFYRRIGPALELGRSFIRPEYQKSYSPLLLLWKGIGHYIAKNPKYRVLFGPVSISRDYSDFSRQLIATTLLRHHHAEDIAAMIRPKSPPALKPIRIKGCRPDWLDSFCDHVEDVNSVVADIEVDNKGIPVLLKHYLKLGGRLLAFNVDNKFQDTLDGLIVVDLFKNEPKALERYMGPDGAALFFAYHRILSEKNGRMLFGEIAA